MGHVPAPGMLTVKEVKECGSAASRRASYVVEKAHVRGGTDRVDSLDPHPLP